MQTIDGRSMSNLPPSMPRACSNFRLRQLMRRVSQHYDAELGKGGLKTTQYSLLSHVARLGPLRPGELAHGMSIDASTLTRNLKPLVAAGLLSVAPGSDGRSHAVAITALGRSKRNDAQRHWKAAQDALEALLGEEDVSAMHALIDRCLERFSKVEAGNSHA
jgi:DNA-binding MarR family transcriptional regulator